MNRTCWIWQFDHIPSLNVPKLLASQGFNRVAVKIADGSDWQGTFDKSPDGIHSITDAISWLQAFNKTGLAMDVWVNCQVTNPAQRTIYETALGELPGRLILDLEPYALFWGGHTSLDPLTDWLGSIRANWLSRVWLAPDSRLSNLAWYAPILPLFAGFCPQIYVPSWRLEAREYDFPGVIEPILSISEIVADWTKTVRDDVLGNTYGMSGYGIYRAPITVPEQVDWIQTH